MTFVKVGIDIVPVTDPDLVTSCDEYVVMFVQNAASHVS